MRLRCQNERGCCSPIACGTWAYCRERNFDHGVPDETVQATWRRADQQPFEENPDVND